MPEWRFLLFAIRNVKVNPKICHVNVIGKMLTPFLKGVANRLPFEQRPRPLRG